MLSVVGNRSDVLIARRKINPVEPIGVSDRTCLAQLAPDRMGILCPARVKMVEIPCPVGNRSALVHMVTFPRSRWRIRDNWPWPYGPCRAGLPKRCRSRSRDPRRIHLRQTAPARLKCSARGLGNAAGSHGLSRWRWERKRSRETYSPLISFRRYRSHREKAAHIVLQRNLGLEIDVLRP